MRRSGSTGGSPVFWFSGGDIGDTLMLPMTKSLDLKLANIRANPGGAKDFILADAKDADMAAGLAATGNDPITGKPRSLAEYRDQMRAVLKQGLIDILLTSASTMDELAIRDRAIEGQKATAQQIASYPTPHQPSGFHTDLKA